VARHRGRLHQHTRELRASARRLLGEQERRTGERLRAIDRRAQATAGRAARGESRAHDDAATLVRSGEAALARRRRDLERLAGVLAAHDPQRTLERGYALVEDAGGEPVTSAAAAAEREALSLRMHDGRVEVRRSPPYPGRT
jgi:exodeoxyribonuclease VII large subunit